MANQQERHQLAEEHRAFNAKVEQLRAEGAYSREINAEYAAHQRRIAAIQGTDDDPPCIGSSGGPTA